MEGNQSFWGEVIHSYTRAQALNDGVLIDVSEAAARVGFKFPVVITRTAHSAAVAWSGCDAWQDEDGRLWDVLFVAARTARSERSERMPFRVAVLPNRPGAEGHEMVELELTITTERDGKAVLTIMLPGED
jgi:hypothetical protein